MQSSDSTPAFLRLARRPQVALLGPAHAAQAPPPGLRAPPPGPGRPRPRRWQRTFGFHAPEAAALAPPLTRSSGFQSGSPGPRAMELRAADREQLACPNLPTRLAPCGGRGEVETGRGGGNPPPVSPQASPWPAGSEAGG